jgi:hypothetical protein
MSSVGQRSLIALEQDATRGAFEVVVSAVFQRPHERGQPDQAHSNRNRHEKK